MSINIYIFFSKMSPQCHMLSTTCLFQFLTCQLTCGFSFTSHTTCQILNCVSIDMHFLYAIFCVSNVKNLQKLCQKYTLLIYYNVSVVYSKCNKLPLINST